MKWRNPFKRENQSISVADRGDNYYAKLEVDGELIMAIFQPPASYESDTGVSMGAKVYDAEGNLDVNHSKDMKYGKPIIVFKEDNKHGFKLVDMLPQAKTNLTEALKEHKDIKISVDDLQEDNAVLVRESNRIAVGDSLLQISSKDMGIIYTPRIKPELKPVLDLFLRFMVRSIFPDTPKYRANIMILDVVNNQLIIFSSYNMQDDKDQTLKISANTGGAGKAIEIDDIEPVDLNVYSHGRYRINPDLIWEKMKSLVSIPIHDSRDAIIGVLNIDCEQKLYDSGFLEDRFKQNLRLASSLVGQIIEKAESQPN